MNPLSKIASCGLVGVLAQALNEELAADVDVLLTLGHVRHGVNIVDDPSSLAVLLVARLGENITMLAESSRVVGAVETRLVERIGVPIDLVNCLGAGTQRNRVSEIDLEFPENTSNATHSEQETSS